MNGNRKTNWEKIRPVGDEVQGPPLGGSGFLAPIFQSLGAADVVARQIYLQLSVTPVGNDTDGEGTHRRGFELGHEIIGFDGDAISVRLERVVQKEIAKRPSRGRPGVTSQLQNHASPQASDMTTVPQPGRCEATVRGSQDRDPKRPLCGSSSTSEAAAIGEFP